MSTSIRNYSTKELVKLHIDHHTPGARYASFPTPSAWSLDTSNDVKSFYTNLESNKLLNLYIHIPFCKHVCTFCGCHIKVGEDTSDQKHYIDSLLKEWDTYTSKSKLSVSRIFIGGGTPNFLERNLLEYLVQSIKKKVENPDSIEVVIEMDPRYPVKDFIEFDGLYRVHFGVQDLNQSVLKNVGRYQDPRDVYKSIKTMRSHNIDTGIDLIYGLPLQAADSLEVSIQMMSKENALPCHLNVYPLAKVPWMEGLQKAFGDFSLPSNEQKYEIFVRAYKALIELDFFYLGFGKFLGKNSTLYKAYLDNRLTRNQMGFFHSMPSDYLGIGVGALSLVGGHYKLNEKVLSKYTDGPTEKAYFSRTHIQTEAEQRFLHQVTEITSKKNSAVSLDAIPEKYKTENGQELNSLGRLFLKNLFLKMAPKP